MRKSVAHAFILIGVCRMIHPQHMANEGCDVGERWIKLHLQQLNRSPELL